MEEYRRQLKEIVAEGRKGDAVARFIKLVGASDEDIAGIRQMPDWPLFEAIGHTLAYDAAAMGEDASVPARRVTSVAVPALIMTGGESYPFMQDAAAALASAMPNARHLILEGQTHEVSAEAIAPILVEFFNSTS